MEIRAPALGVPAFLLLIASAWFAQGATATITLSDPVYAACGNLSISGTAAPATGDAISHTFWNWGDGTTSTSQFPAGHQYSTNGTFIVQVVAASQAGGSISASKQVTVTSSADPGCPQLSVGPYYSMSPVAGVNFAAGETIKAAAIPIRDFYARISVDRQNNLYISDFNGNRVWRVTPTGTGTVVAGNGSRDAYYSGWAVPGTLYPGATLPLQPYAAAADDSGSVYILVAKPTDNYTAYLYKATAAGTWLLGSSSPTGFDAGETGMAVDPLGNVYVGNDFYYNGVTRFSPSGQPSKFETSHVATYLWWANGALYFTDSDSQPGAIGRFDSSGTASILATGSHPSGVAVDAGGNVYYCAGATVQKIESDGTSSRVVGTGVIGSDGDGGPAASARIACRDLAIDHTGALYLMDVGNTRVRKVAGGAIDTFAGGGELNALATESALLGPGVVLALPGGDLLVADQMASPAPGVGNQGFRRIAPDGHWQFLHNPPGPYINPMQAGTVSSGIIYGLLGNDIVGWNADGTVASGLRVLGSDIDLLSGLAADNGGNFYVAGAGRSADGEIGRLWKVAPDGGTVALLDIPGGRPGYQYHIDVCADAGGNLFLTADTRVLKRTPQGLVTTVAGTGQTGLSGDDGPATSAPLSGASAIAVDALGNLYISDIGNRRVRMVTADGVIHTIAVTGPPQEPTDVFYTGFDMPGRITVDKAGNVYFSETADGVVRKLTPNRPTRVVSAGGDLQHAAARSPLAQPLRVQITGQTGTPVEAMLVAWKVASGAATLGAGSTLTDSSGQAKMTVTASDVVGPITITATAGSLPPVAFSITVDAPPATVKIASGDNQTGALGSALPSPLVVQVLTAGGSPAVAIAVSFAVTSGTAVLSANSVLTEADGTAKVYATLGSLAGTTVISATVAGLLPAQFHLIAASSPSINPGGVVHAASGQAVLAPGSLATVYGAGFTSTTAIVDNFSGPDSPGGYSVGLYGSGPDSYAIGYSFSIPAGNDVVFTGGAYVGSFGTGTNSVIIALRSDSGGKPGAVLESMKLVDVLTGSGTTIGFSSTVAPALLAGRLYWLTAEMTYPATSTSYWWTPSQTDRGITAASLNGGPWVVSTGNRGTFRIFAAPIARAGATPLPTTLGNASVSLGGRNVPLAYVGPTQINFQVPYETQHGSYSLIVTAAGLASLPVSVAVANAAPGIFVYGNNWAVVQNADYSVNGPSNPARTGEYVTLYGTGAGAVNPPVATGVAAPATPLSQPAASVAASVNGVPAQVIFSGLTPLNVGLIQVNLQIPDLPTGTYPVQISVGGVLSNTPSLAVAR